MEGTGLEKIVSCLFFEQANTLTDIRTKTGLTKPTILHHLQNLKNDGMVKPEDGKYYLHIDPTLKTDVLEEIDKSKNLKEFMEKLEKKATKTKHKQLQSFFKVGKRHYTIS